MAKLITVFGSTGNQGGSVVRAILNHSQLSNEWKVRGITRNPNKPDAQAMAAQGVEMVAADLNSKESILSAIKGSNAVFGVTNYWEKASLEHEVQQGKNLADAAKESGVEHLIWSSLPYVSKITAGELHNLHHFDSKAMVEEYVNQIGQPASFVLPAYFMSNVPGSIKPTPNGGQYSLSWLFHPDTQIPMLDVPRDFGKFVASCLANPSATLGKHTLAASGWFTPLDICNVVENCTGKKCVFHEVPVEQYQGSKELFDNLMMIREYEYYGPSAQDGVKSSHEVVTKVGGWEGFGTFENFLQTVGI
ncbi:NAD(P)-binding protein [Cucurbitaria berberidis CBS 394.84]|uniref:NAD(P)-binding protein n=1 Tax=Cucurbitaria berberidis CBS 394.84 TaxID=1168544 RepID=A0A9P4LB54_9PLEO|nr:NAD(P)-binding protein [Cucurbitaria berberidis CBS 394.84]KAF1848032.1 NAD(P)-binding protein [Cucurbitaria berberidis CBS 394.84]